ncbi:hypothetical protein [Burkholderia cepacia]
MTAQLRAYPGSAGHHERMAKYGFTHVEIEATRQAARRRRHA